MQLTPNRPSGDWHYVHSTRCLLNSGPPITCKLREPDLMWTKFVFEFFFGVHRETKHYKSSGGTSDADSVQRKERNGEI